MSDANLHETDPQEQATDALGVAYLLPHSAPLTDADKAALMGATVAMRLRIGQYDTDWRVRRIREEARTAARYAIRALRGRDT